MTLDELKILITAETSGLRRGLNDVRNQLKNTTGNVNSSTSSMTGGLKKMAAGIIAAFSIKQIIQFGKQCVETSNEIENAWIGLNSVLNGQGKSFDVAKDFIQSYVSDGLVPLNDAVTAYKNLSLRGYTSDQIQNTMERLKDSASFARQSCYTLGEAVVTATEGLKNENSILVDNAGVTKNVAKMWEDYAKSLGTTSNKLTQQQKITAEVNGIMQETKFQVGDSAKYANTFSGQVSKLKANLTTMANEIGNIIKPILSAFIPVINGAINVITEFARKIEGLMNAAGIQTNVLSSLKSIAGASSNVSSNMDNVTESTKKAKNMLMGFDEINKLTKDDEDDEDDSTETNSSNNAKNDLDSANQEGYKLSDTMQSIINKAKELASEFKTGFSEGLGDDFNASLERTKEHLSNIGANIKDIFTDSDVQAAASNLANKLFNNLGKVAGSFVSIGQSIIENIVGGFDIYLDRAKEKIKGWLIRMCNIEGETLDIIGNTSQAISNIFSVIRSDVAKHITADFIQIISDTIMGSIEIFAKLGRDILDTLTAPFIDNQESIKQTILDTLEPVKTCYDSVASTVSYWWDTLNQTYDEHIAPMFQSLKEGFTEIVALLLEKYNQYILPVLNELAPKVTDLYENHIKPALGKISEVIGKVGDMIKEIWEKTTKPFIEWIINTMVPIVAPIIKRVGEIIISVAGTIWDVINDLFGIFGGLIDFVAGVFTGNWSKAWQGVVDIFSGIWNTIKDVLKAPLNYVIDQINGLIESINDITNFDIPGIGNVGISIPTIPKLAQGGYVQANTPQLAMIGDNTHEGEIVAPESKIAEAVSRGIATALQSMQNVTSNNSPTELVIKIGEDTIGRLAVNGINSLTKMNGASGLII